jgi:hypothetical protein
MSCTVMGIFIEFRIGKKSARMNLAGGIKNEICDNYAVTTLECLDNFRLRLSAKISTRGIDAGRTLTLPVVLSRPLGRSPKA